MALVGGAGGGSTLLGACGAGVTFAGGSGVCGVCACAVAERAAVAARMPNARRTFIDVVSKGSDVLPYRNSARPFQPRSANGPYHYTRRERMRPLGGLGFSQLLQRPCRQNPHDRNGEESKIVNYRAFALRNASTSEACSRSSPWGVGRRGLIRVVRYRDGSTLGGDQRQRSTDLDVPSLVHLGLSEIPASRYNLKLSPGETTRG